MRLGECGHASEQRGIEQAVFSENEKQGRIESPTLVRVNLRSCLGTVLETRKGGYNISKIKSGIAQYHVPLLSNWALKDVPPLYGF